MKRKSETRGQSSQSRKLTVPAEWSRRGVESQSIQDELMESIELFDDNENSPVYDRIAYNQEDAKQDTSIQSFSDSFDNLPFDPIDPDKVFDTVAADQQQQQQQQYDSSIHSFSDSFDANSRNDSRLPTDNILAGLDQWRPKPDSSQISTQEENYRPDSHQSERPKSPQFVFGSDNVKTEMETDNDDREFYWPEFILPTSSSKSTNHQQEQKVDPKVFVSNGLASTAFNFIEQEKQEYLKWEQRVHAQMAIHGSMVQLYLDNEGVELYRILEMESKYGNIVGRCIRLRQDEIECLKLQREKAQASRNLDDIEEFSQPAVLPAYEPQDDDQEVSILFSFRFSQMSKAAKDRFLRESLVAVFDKGHQDANIITTKFMAESLH